MKQGYYYHMARASTAISAFFRYPANKINAVKYHISKLQPRHHSNLWSIIYLGICLMIISSYGDMPSIIWSGAHLFFTESGPYIFFDFSVHCTYTCLLITSIMDAIRESYHLRSPQKLIIRFVTKIIVIYQNWCFYRKIC